MSAETPEILPLGLHGLVVRFALVASPEIIHAVRAFAAELETRPIEGVTEIASSLVTVFVGFSSELVSRETLIQALTERLQLRDWTEVARPTPTRRWHIPVSFGGGFGPQLEEAAAQTGFGVEAAVEDLCAADVEVITIGFAPGQAYMGFLDERWDIPRQAELTPAVPAGALILAIRQLIVFTSENATGWHHIGQSGFLPFDLRRETPLVFRAGDAVRFHPVSESEIHAILSDNPDGLGRARCEVLL